MSREMIEIFQPLLLLSNLRLKGQFLQLHCVFAAHTDGFNAILRKRGASLLSRIRCSTNVNICVVVDRVEYNLKICFDCM